MKKSFNALLFVSIAVLILLSLNVVYADETHVIVKGIKGYVLNITLNVINPNSDALIVSLENDTVASTGLADFYYSSAAQKVTYYVVARSSGKIVASKNSLAIGNFSTGPGVTTIDLFPTTKTTTTSTSTTITVNTTANSSDTNVSEDASDSGDTTTINLGNSFISGTWTKIKAGLSNSWKWIVYGFLVLAAIGGIVYAVFWWMRRPKKTYEFTATKKDNLVMPGDNERQISRSGRKIEDELASAEQKIKEAQEEIARIKSKKNRLNEAKQKYEQAKKDLENAKEEIEGEY
ncbi:MAG: hypothetical protein AABX17_02905 [Nanoarchaeota archaeon]